ncbi:hypothetical protein BG000_001523 [Podila horticola]|nr:hypothetical protein BG000_001523 [Podila horticola]
MLFFKTAIAALTAGLKCNLNKYECEPRRAHNELFQSNEMCHGFREPCDRAEGQCCPGLKCNLNKYEYPHAPQGVSSDLEARDANAQSLYLRGGPVQYLPYGEQEHIGELQLHDDYKNDVQRQLVDLVLHHNAEFITILHFHVADSHRCLPFADKLKKLQIMHLNRDEFMPDSHLQNTILFIVQNRITFPRKPPLRIEFGNSWNGPDWGTITPELRQRQHIVQNPRTALYAAIGNPPALDISRYPGFYSNCGNIDAESLEMLDDQDMGRMALEGPEQQTFLKQCHRLRHLQLAVSHSDLFSWAVQKKLDGTTQSQDKKVPRNLNTLILSSNRGSNLLLPALDDAMVTFTQSLVKVIAKGHFSYEKRKGGTPTGHPKTFELYLPTANVSQQQCLTAQACGPKVERQLEFTKIEISLSGRSPKLCLQFRLAAGMPLTEVC